jgi:hypothetical protein
VTRSRTESHDSTRHGLTPATVDESNRPVTAAPRPRVINPNMPPMGARLTGAHVTHPRSVAPSSPSQRSVLSGRVREGRRARDARSPSSSVEGGRGTSRRAIRYEPNSRWYPSQRVFSSDMNCKNAGC